MTSTSTQVATAAAPAVAAETYSSGRGETQETHQGKIVQNRNLLLKLASFDDFKWFEVQSP